MKRFVFFILFLLSCTAVMAQEECSLDSSEYQRPKVALVLGGGGAKGAATVGALKYVEQSGVPIDMIVGTSIGSIVGGMYSLGYRSVQLDSLFRTQEWTRMFTGSLMGDSIIRVLRANLGGDYTQVDFDSLPIPFRCVAVDINTMTEVVLKEGDLAQAIRASMSIPLLFKPVKMEGQRLVDGGMLNNLPVDVAKEMGAEYVIAIDLAVNTQGNQQDEDDEDEERGFFKDLYSVVSWSVSRPDKEKYQSNLQQADVYINPILKGYGAKDFSRTKLAEMIAIGEQAGQIALKDLEELKKKLMRQSDD